MCNVKYFEYDEKSKKLIINYKISGEKNYLNFSKKSYLKLFKLNQNKKTIGLCLRKELSKKK